MGKAPVNTSGASSRCLGSSVGCDLVFFVAFGRFAFGVSPLRLTLVACGGFALFFICLAPHVGFGPLRSM